MESLRQRGRRERDPVARLLDEALELAEQTVGACAQRTSGGDLLDGLQRNADLGRVVTRIGACVAWLLARRAVAAGEIAPDTSREEKWRLLRLQDPFWEQPPLTSDPVLADLVRRSARLYDRIKRLDADLERLTA